MVVFDSGTDVFIVQGRRQIGRRPVAGSEKPCRTGRRRAGHPELGRSFERRGERVLRNLDSGQRQRYGKRHGIHGDRTDQRHRIHFFGESRLRVRVVRRPYGQENAENRSDQLHGLHGRSSPGGL